MTRRKSRKLRATLGSLMVAAAVAGCAGEPAPGAASLIVERTQRGDTAVVRNVSGQQWPENPRLVEVVRIGQANGPEEYTFAAIVAMAARGNGPVYVYDHRLHLLRMYDERGRFVRQMGRIGGGPGEYRYVIGLSMMAEGRVAAWDVRGNRVTVYTPTGEPASDIVVGKLSQFFIADALTVDSAGRFLIVTNSLGRLATVVVDSTGTVVDTIPNPRPRLPMEGATRLHPTFEFTIDPRGYYVWGDADRYEIHSRTPAGAPMIISRDAGAPPVSAAEAERVRADARGASIDVPATKPFFATVKLNRDGSVWVLREDVATSADSIAPRFFDVFSSDGAYQGRVDVPPRAVISVFDGRDLWGYVLDDDDVPYVVHYRLEG